jgi:hypothetical protein
MRTMILLTLTFSVMSATAASADGPSCLGNGDITSQAAHEAWKRRCVSCGGTVVAGNCKFPQSNPTGQTAPAPGTAAEAITQAALSGSSRDAAQGLMNYGTQTAADAMRKAIQGDPEAGAQRRAAAQRSAVARAAQEAREAERAQGLLGEMLGSEGATAGAGSADDSGLALMLGDQPVQRSAAATPRPGATSSAGSAPAPARSQAWSLGYADGIGCYSQNAGVRCSAAANDEVDTCLKEYRLGYGAGEKIKKMELDLAHQRGRDHKAKRVVSAGASQPEATGSCRIEWIQRYNNGYQGVP